MSQNLRTGGVRALIATGTLLLAGVSAQAGVFTPVYNPVTNHYYAEIFIGTPNTPAGITWAEARDLATTITHLGTPGHLVTITDAAEMSFVIDQFQTACIDLYWLGGYQDFSAPDYSEPSGGWRWVTGEAWSYTNWHQPGEPNNSRGEEVLSLWRDNWEDPYVGPYPAGQIGTWNDEPSWYRGAGLIIEWPVPAPGFAGLGLGGLALMARRRR